jgi:hypothetical protein
VQGFCALLSVIFPGYIVPERGRGASTLRAAVHSTFILLLNCKRVYYWE